MPIEDLAGFALLVAGSVVLTGSLIIALFINRRALQHLDQAKELNDSCRKHLEETQEKFKLENKEGGTDE